MTVWQQSFELLVPLLRDKTTKNYPSDERFGLISDMRPPDRIIRAGRSANSIAPPARAGLRDLAAFPRDPLESLSIAFIHRMLCIRFHAAVHTRLPQEVADR